MEYPEYGWEENLYNWNLDILKNNGARFDMIGMSPYPYWTEIYHNKTAKQTISGCMTNIKKMSAKYGCDVMIVETGMLCADDNGKLGVFTEDGRPTKIMDAFKKG